eukprot:GHVP01015706.1.p1 GENE.GHVP01015706.1~~GHVP01015706.1.p1  ORF type:complete len:311 (-),score=63.74 GHVP01015706.1:90-887(-)
MEEDNEFMDWESQASFSEASCAYQSGVLITTCIKKFHHSLSDVEDDITKKLQATIDSSVQYKEIIEKACACLKICWKDLNWRVTLPSLYPLEEPNLQFIGNIFQQRNGPRIRDPRRRSQIRKVSEVLSLQRPQENSQSIQGVTCKFIDGDDNHTSFYVDKRNQGIFPIYGKIFSEVWDADKKVKEVISELLNCLRARFSEEFKKKLNLATFPPDRKIHFSRFPLSGVDVVEIENFEVQTFSAEFSPEKYENDDSTEFLIYPKPER